MENTWSEVFSKAYENIQDIDILECPEEDIFNNMQSSLLKAFDKETTFDMRLFQQMELMRDKGSIAVNIEKDGNLYPLIKLIILIKDGYYDEKAKLFKVQEHRTAEFELSLTPFTCSLEKHGKSTGGIYSGSDKELTKAWRLIMKGAFPAWEGKFRTYLETIKNAKINSSNKEFNEELSSVGLQ